MPSEKAVVRAERWRRSYMGVAVHNAGLRKAGRAMSFGLWWGLMCDREGRELSIAEYIEVANESQATVYRELQAFRECFPGLALPAFWADIRQQIWSQDRSVALAEAMSARAPRGLGVASGQ